MNNVLLNSIFRYSFNRVKYKICVIVFLLLVYSGNLYSDKGKYSLSQNDEYILIALKI